MRDHNGPALTSSTLTISPRGNSVGIGRSCRMPFQSFDMSDQFWQVCQRAQQKDKTMARKSNAAVQPQPEMVVAPVIEQPVISNEAAPVVPVAKLNIFAASADAISKRVQDKMAIMGSIKQRLAEARDYFEEGKGKTAEGQAVADKAAIHLYQAQTLGYVTKDEVSSALGDYFGFKPKTDGKPGKTPMGEGEAIRKRIVRAVAATEYVTNGDGGKFFSGLPEAEVASVVASLDNGDISIWTAYEQFADIKKALAVRTLLAFNVAQIKAINETLALPSSGAIIRGNLELVAVYGTLVSLLTIIGEEPVSEEAEEEE